jgi:hypothetical protein
MFTVVQDQDDDVEEMQTRRHTALSADRTSYHDHVRAQGLDLEAEKPPTDRSLLAEMLVSKIARSDLLLSGHALGEGSTGTVYRGIVCHDTVCETEVAVKVMHTNMNEDSRKHALADLRQVFLSAPHQPSRQTSSSIPSDLAHENHCCYSLYCS